MTNKCVTIINVNEINLFIKRNKLTEWVKKKKEKKPKHNYVLFLNIYIYVPKTK